jgi:hypothetical protein
MEASAGREGAKILQKDSPRRMCGVQPRTKAAPVRTGIRPRGPDGRVVPQPVIAV